MPLSIKQNEPQDADKINQYPASAPNTPTLLPRADAHTIVEQDEYEILNGGKAKVKRNLDRLPVYADIAGPRAARSNSAQFATASGTSITPYNGAYIQSVGSGSPSRRRIFTGGDGSVGIRG